MVHQGLIIIINFVYIFFYSTQMQEFEEHTLKAEKKVTRCSERVSCLNTFFIGLCKIHDIVVRGYEKCIVSLWLVQSSRVIFFVMKFL